MSASTTSVRALAARHGLREIEVERALADTIRHAQPWYVTALAGLGTWVGAFLIALALFTLHILDGDGARVVCGLALLVAGACASRLDRGVIATQVAMIGSVAGQLLFLSGFGNDDSFAIAVGLLLQLVVIVAVDRPLTKALASLAFFGFLLAFLADHDLPADALPIVTALVAASAWLGERSVLRVPALGVAVRPVGIASVLSLCGFLLFEAVAMSTGVTRSPFTLASPAALAVGLGVIAAVALVVIARRRAGIHVATVSLRPPASARFSSSPDAGSAPPSPAPAAVVVAGAAIAIGVLLSLDAPGLVAALLVIVLGVGARARLLVGVGLAFLFAFLALTYYRLDVTLTSKALWAVGTGALVLVVRACIHAQRDAARSLSRFVSKSAFLRDRRGAQLVVVATLLSLGVPFALVVHKERVLARGEHILLPLAPRDPRSLMQGDFMELRTVVARAALDAVHATRAGERTGRVVVRIDADRVATFVRLDDDTPLAPDERRLKFRVRGTQWTEHMRIGAEELFFEEGRAKHYEAARFGEVVVDGDGDTVLVGVRDEAKRPL
jgi:uncharacterized membrane-anchored protein